MQKRDRKIYKCHLQLSLDLWCLQRYNAGKTLAKAWEKTKERMGEFAHGDNSFTALKDLQVLV